MASFEELDIRLLIFLRSKCWLFGADGEHFFPTKTLYIQHAFAVGGNRKVILSNECFVKDTSTENILESSTSSIIFPEQEKRYWMFPTTSHLEQEQRVVLWGAKRADIDTWGSQWWQQWSPRDQTIQLDIYHPRHRAGTGERRPRESSCQDQYPWHSRRASRTGSRYFDSSWRLLWWCLHSS